MNFAGGNLAASRPLTDEVGGITGGGIERETRCFWLHFLRRRSCRVERRREKGEVKEEEPGREFEGKLGSRGGICQEKLLVALGIFIRRWRAR